MCRIAFGFILLLNIYSSCCRAIFLIAPTDVSTGLLTVYGFTPPILLGTSSRLGWGFRVGEHADLQVLYEFGPSADRRPLRVRAPRKNIYPRRPLTRLFIKAGLFKSPYEPRTTMEDDDEPR